MICVAGAGLSSDLYFGLIMVSDNWLAAIIFLKAAGASCPKFLNFEFSIA